METIVGREEEKKILTAPLQSRDAELIAVYGRRRIGKTFLIRNHYHKHIVFELTGIHEAGMKNQLRNFSLALQEAMGIPVAPAPPDNWIEAFRQLSDHLKKNKGKNRSWFSLMNCPGCVLRNQDFCRLLDIGGILGPPETGLLK